MTVHAGRVFWFTGLSGSGKTTLCASFVEHARARGMSIVMLDGDELREILAGPLAYDVDSRRALALRYARLCDWLSRQGMDVAIATISLFAEVHAWNREHLRHYVEILIDVPYAELRRRDSKGIYSRAERGELRDVAGVDLPVDLPVAPDVVIKYRDGAGVDAALVDLLQQLDTIAISRWERPTP